MSSDALLFGVLTHHGLPYWTLAMISGFAHTIYTLIVLFIVFGLVERLGFCGISVWRSLCGSVAEHENSLLPLPVPTPTVCVQLPMYNERAVAARRPRRLGGTAPPRRAPLRGTRATALPT